MPKAGEYLLVTTGFSLKEKPVVTLQREGSFYDLEPLDRMLTLEFDMTSRFCTGWRDITTGRRDACPDHQLVSEKYEQCQACQERTGFNPAFYHATTVSKQQEARNLEPHILYLAHFAPGIIKVGISYAKRGRSRLLEQGARSALILDTFPTALIARQYEAKIARMAGIIETIQLRKKISLLTHPYDTRGAERELLAMKAAIEQSLHVSFDNDTGMSFDTTYFPGGTPRLDTAHDCTTTHRISGKVVGMIGSVLFTSYQDTVLYLPLKKYTGHTLLLAYEETLIDLPAQQTSLF